MTTDFQPVRLQSMAFAAPDVMAIELVHPNGRALPAYDPGARIDVRLPNSLVRPYWLVGLHVSARTRAHAPDLDRLADYGEGVRGVRVVSALPGQTKITVSQSIGIV